MSTVPSAVGIDLDPCGEKGEIPGSKVQAANTDSVILEEDLDPDYTPQAAEVDEYARWLGMDPVGDSDLLWVAREGLLAPLPVEWKPCRTKDAGELYYFNFSSGESTWDHPCDEYYKRLFEEEKKKKETRLKEQSDSKKAVAKVEAEKMLGRREKKKRRSESARKTARSASASITGGSTADSDSARSGEPSEKELPSLPRVPLPKINPPPKVSTEEPSKAVTISPRSRRAKLSPSQSSSSHFFADDNDSPATAESSPMKSKPEFSTAEHKSVASSEPLPVPVAITAPSVRSPANSSKEVAILIERYESQIAQLQLRHDQDARLIDSLQLELAQSQAASSRSEQELKRQLREESRQHQLQSIELETKLRAAEGVQTALQSKLQLAEGDVSRYKELWNQLATQQKPNQAQSVTHMQMWEISEMERTADRLAEDRFNSLMAAGDSKRANIINDDQWRRKVDGLQLELDKMTLDRDSQTRSLTLELEAVQAAYRRLQEESEVAARLRDGIHEKYSALSSSYETLLEKHRQLQLQNRRLHQQRDIQSQSDDNESTNEQICILYDQVERLEYEREALMSEIEKLRTDSETVISELCREKLALQAAADRDRAADNRAIADAERERDKYKERYNKLLSSNSESKFDDNTASHIGSTEYSILRPSDTGRAPKSEVVPMSEYRSLKEALQQAEKEHAAELLALTKDRGAWRSKYQSLSAEFERSEELNEELRVQIQKLMANRTTLSDHHINSSVRSSTHSNEQLSISQSEIIGSIDVDTAKRTRIREMERESLKADFEVRLFLATSETKTLQVRVTDLETQLAEVHEAHDRLLSEMSTAQQNYNDDLSEKTERLVISQKYISELEQLREDTQRSFQAELQRLSERGAAATRQLEESVQQWRSKYQLLQNKYNSMLQEYTDYRSSVQLRLTESRLTEESSIMPNQSSTVSPLQHIRSPVGRSMVSVATETETEVVLEEVDKFQPGSLPVPETRDDGCAVISTSESVVDRPASEDIEIVEEEEDHENEDEEEEEEEEVFESLELKMLGSNKDAQISQDRQHTSRRTLSHSASTAALISPIPHSTSTNRLSTSRKTSTNKRTGKPRETPHIEAIVETSEGKNDTEEVDASSDSSGSNEVLSLALSSSDDSCSCSDSEPTSSSPRETVEQQLAAELNELVTQRMELDLAKRSLKRQVKALRREKDSWKKENDSRTHRSKGSSKSAHVSMAEWNQRAEALNESIQQLNDSSYQLRNRESVIRTALGAFADDEHRNHAPYKTPHITPSKAHMTPAGGLLGLRTHSPDVRASSLVDSVIRQQLKPRTHSSHADTRYIGHHVTSSSGALAGYEAQPHPVFLVQVPLHSAAIGRHSSSPSRVYATNPTTPYYLDPHIFTRSPHPESSPNNQPVSEGVNFSSSTTYIDSRLPIQQRSRMLREEVDRFTAQQESSTKLFEEHSRWLTDLDKRLNTFRI